MTPAFAFFILLLSGFVFFQGWFYRVRSMVWWYFGLRRCLVILCYHRLPYMHVLPWRIFLSIQCSEIGCCYTWIIFCGIKKFIYLLIEDLLEPPTYIRTWYIPEEKNIPSRFGLLFRAYDYASRVLCQKLVNKTLYPLSRSDIPHLDICSSPWADSLINSLA